MHADLQHLLGRELIPDVTAVPLDDLRDLRVECSAAEGDVSFVRRLVQGRIDIVGHEHRRRAGAADGTVPDVAALLFDLPDIMSERAGGPSGRHMAVHELGTIAQSLVEQLDQVAKPSQLANLDRLDQPELVALFDALRDFEVELSTTRRRLHERIDAIQNEIARRYRDGEASIDTLLN